MSECCKSGFKWTGEPTGKTTKLAGLDTYVAGTNTDRAILIVADIYGWTFKNARILADQYAAETNASVYLPDFFGGEVLDAEALTDSEKRKNFDLGAFIGRNSKEIRFPEIVAATKALRAQGFKKIGAIGFCYGGWAVFQLGSQSNKLVDFISTAHPSLLTKEEIAAISVPVQILSPETDPMYTPELKEYSQEKIPTLLKQSEFEYIFFPGLAHGFATRGDPDNKLQKEGLEKALQDFVNWANKQFKL